MAAENPGSYFLPLPLHVMQEAMKQKEDDLMREVEQLKQKLSEIERLSKGRGLSGILHFRQDHAVEGGSKPAAPA